MGVTVVTPPFLTFEYMINYHFTTVPPMLSDEWEDIVTSKSTLCWNYISPYFCGLIVRRNKRNA
jgi:hypothetical protein